MSLTYPTIDPIAVSIGPLAIHWYGLMYLLGFGLAWLVARWRVKNLHLKWTADQIGDLIFFAAVGTVLGGRIGYMLFYGTSLQYCKSLARRHVLSRRLFRRNLCHVLLLPNPAQTFLSHH